MSSREEEADNELTRADTRRYVFKEDPAVEEIREERVRWAFVFVLWYKAAPIFFNAVLCFRSLLSHWFSIPCRATRSSQWRFTTPSLVFQLRRLCLKSGREHDIFLEDARRQQKIYPSPVHFGVWVYRHSDGNVFFGDVMSINLRHRSNLQSRFGISLGSYTALYRGVSNTTSTSSMNFARSRIIFCCHRLGTQELEGNNDSRASCMIISHVTWNQSV